MTTEYVIEAMRGGAQLTNSGKRWELAGKRVSCVTMMALESSGAIRIELISHRFARAVLTE